MKIVVTYETADIIELIKKDLTNSVLKYDISTGKWKGSARFTIEVEGQVSVEAEAAPVSAPPSPAETPKALEVKKPETKPSQDPPMDLDEIMALSQENASNKQGLYPVGRQMMEGESTEWPGAPEPRGR